MKIVTIAGRLTKDARLNRTQAGDPVVGFAVAVDHWNGREKTAEFFDCSYWGDRAAKLQQYLTKGASVTVSGDLGRREHEGRTYFTIRVNELSLQGGGQKQDAEPAPARQAPGAAASIDDEIPFAPEWR